jgi:hypothetical protein
VQKGWANSKDVVRRPDAVSVPTTSKPICKPDAPEWNERGETDQTERVVLVPVRRGHRTRERSSGTPETCVVLLINPATADFISEDDGLGLTAFGS